MNTECSSHEGQEVVEKPRNTQQIVAMVSAVLDSLIRRGSLTNPLIVELFQDPDIFLSFPDEMVGDEEKLKEIILNTSKFSDLVSHERRRGYGDVTGLLGEEVLLAESTHSDGRARRAESGRRVNVGWVRTQGIDPSKVLFFRITQPSDKPKPEYYWTSDYAETKKGLRREIPAAQRSTAVILVSSLEDIHRNQGIIQDINDDHGLAVRQIGTENFDQKSALGIIQLEKRNHS